jgi:pimeloyl-ACP methyl ester carboxylesterase
VETTAHAQPTARRLGDLAADDYGRDDDRAPIVLLHGMSFDRTIWSGLVADLQSVDPGRRVLALDLPGHGQSEEQSSYALTEVPDLLHRALVESGLQAPIVVGHSAGALAATVYAAHHPTRGVINVDQSLQISPFAALVRSLAPRLRGPEFTDVWQLFYASFHTELLPADAQELVRSTCRPRQRVVLGFWHQLLERPTEELVAMIDDALSAVRTTGVPYLHIAGDEPGAEYRDWLGQRLPAATIDVWPHSGHFPHLARPDRFVQRLAALKGPRPEWTYSP